MPKNKSLKGVNLNKLYDKVARRADTEGLQINVAETKRVIACFFDVLEEYSANDALQIIAKGVKRARMRKQ
jgi:hypothetical protein